MCAFVRSVQVRFVPVVAIYIRKRVTMNDISRATYRQFCGILAQRGRLMVLNDESWRISLFQPR